MGEYLSTGDVAKQAGLTTMGVIQAVKRGDLTPAATTKGGMRLFRPEDVNRYVDERTNRTSREAGK